MNLHLLLAVAAGFLLGSVPSGLAQLKPAETAWPSDPELGRRELDEQWKLIESPLATAGVRGIFRFAVEAAALSYHPERIEAALKLARSMQDLNPASPTFGNFHWRYDQAAVFDRNGVEFCMLQMALLRLRFADGLDKAGLARLDEMMNDGITGMRLHKVTPDYTNIYLTKTWNLIGAGEALGRKDVADEGYAQLDAWMRFTAERGITEYGAVTYFGIDMEALALIAKYAARPEGRAQAETALRFFWLHLAANWWAPGDRYGGTNSRSYDYLFASGYLDSQTWPAGWLRARPKLEGAGWLGLQKRDNLTAVYRAGEWPVPDAVTAPVRAELPRTIVQRWGALPEQRAVQYVGRHFSIGSSGASRAADDRTLVVNLGNTPEVAQMVLFMDGRGDPFGTKKNPEAQGAMKALHLIPFIATSQRGPEVLQILADEPLGAKSRSKPKPDGAPLSCLLTQLTIPTAAELWFGGKPVQPGTPEAPVTVPGGEPVFVRLGPAAVGVRFVFATGEEGRPARIEYVQEKPDAPARRLTIVHSATSARTSAITAVWMRGAEDLDDAGFEKFRAAFAAAKATETRDGSRLAVEVAGEKGLLRLEMDVADGLGRAVVGQEPDALLGVNGRDLGKEMLKEYLPKRTLSGAEPLAGDRRRMGSAASRRGTTRAVE